MAVTSCTANAATTDPSALTNCNSNTPSVVSGSGTACQPSQSKPTQIVDPYQMFIQQYKQANGYAEGGMVRGYACGGPTLVGQGGCGPGGVPLNQPQTGGGSQPPVPTQQNVSGTLNPYIDYNAASCAYAGAGVPGATNVSNAAVEKQTLQNAYSPALPSNEILTPSAIQNSPSQELNPNNYGVNTPQAQTATGGDAQQANAPGSITPSTYSAAQTDVNNPAFTVTAAQGTVDPNAITSNQIQQLTNGIDINNTPAWARGAVNAVNEQLAARGLGTSSIAAGAMVSAIMGAATPIAQANANYFAQLDLANLNNEQQAAMATAQLKSNALLSNTAATNAALQFNATSQNQVNEFMDNLSSQIQLTNAAQVNAMKQFNAGQTNAVSEFNATMDNNVNQFNDQNRIAIDQSNVTWRRNINTLNTAAVNAANQVNVQNAFNMTSTAQNDLWQQMQDQAAWANTDSQNALTRAQNLAIASLATNTAFKLQDQAQQDALMQLLGKFGLNIAGSALNSLFSPTHPAPSGTGSLPPTDCGISCPSNGGQCSNCNNFGGGSPEFQCFCGSPG